MAVDLLACRLFLASPKSVFQLLNSNLDGLTFSFALLQIIGKETSEQGAHSLPEYHRELSLRCPFDAVNTQQVIFGLVPALHFQKLFHHSLACAGRENRSSKHCRSMSMRPCSMAPRDSPKAASRRYPGLRTGSKNFADDMVPHFIYTAS